VEGNEEKEMSDRVIDEGMITKGFDNQNIIKD